ncbi:hypothetical protein ED733_002657 [Metarhizium rileyi]|uniref:Uncharacterized protein n=1 Tax=Metarhizium rileyi (strain RCEF 4871) TaxID=1649241 RepID=A0A5C6GBN3_METRR|nr:hypothetical protein ED733_002657 [Metarhizium rileyi]
MARLRPTSLDGRSGIQPRTVESSRLQIRVVPYSPPRLSSDDSSDSRPMSYPYCSPEQPVFSPLQETANQHERENCDSSSPVVGSHDQGPISHDNPLNLANESTGSVGHVRQTRNWSDANLETILASPSPCYRRAKRTIAINSDKTFSLVQQSCSSTSTTDSPPSSRRLWTNPSSSADRTVSGTCIEDGQSSPLQPVQGRSRPLSPYCSLPASSSPPLPAGLADADASAPCNYTLVGGVRKVPSSVERGGKRKSLSLSSPSAGRNLQVAFVESVSTASSFARPGMPTTEQTFHASESTSTLSERSNYKTFVSESPCYSAGQHLVEADDLSQDHSIPSPELSNIEIIGESCSERSLSNRSGSDTNDSDNNYELHGDFQSSPIITAASISVLKPEYSRESLVVAPLRPGRRILPNRATVSRQRSRDSIRTGSLSSISSAFAEEAARSLFGGSAMISSHGGFRRISSRQNTSIGREHRHLNISQQQQQQHRRSTTLSPVLSESDRGSAVPSLAFSHTTTGDHRRRSQTSALDTPCLSPQDGRSDMEAWEEIPYPASYRVWNRDMNSSSLRLIRDQDEHGDGLAELEALQQCPSRTKFHSYISKFPSDRNLCSSGSSRSNSFSRSYIPTWAR